jgi:hypothetical protein
MKSCRATDEWMSEGKFLYGDFVYRDFSFSRKLDLEVYFTNCASITLLLRVNGSATRMLL